MPIGGLKEKLLAALRSGVKTVLIPIENAKDLVDVPESVKAALEIIPVSTVDEGPRLGVDRTAYADRMGGGGRVPSRASGRG